MKKYVYVLLLVSLFLAGCATAKDKQAAAPEPAYSSGTSYDESESGQYSWETTSSSTGPSPDFGEAVSAITPDKMTKKDVQLALQKAGYYQGAIDGKYGNQTRAAVKAFQKANGLTVDGLVGKKTKAALVKFLN